MSNLNKADCNIVNSNKVNFVVLGIGINLYKPKENFPSDIENLAGYIFEYEVENAKNKLIGTFLNLFLEKYSNFSSTKLLNEYKSLSCILNNDIYVHKNNYVIKAHVLDIDDNCNLMVKYLEGDRINQVDVLSSGEVSTKIIK